MKGYFFEWRLKATTKGKNIFIKLILLTILVSIFLVIYFPRGINGYISQNWKVTIFLKDGVGSERGKIFAERLGRLDFVGSARYFSEEEVWSEFLSSIGKPENLEEVIGSPIPGYIEVRFKQDSVNEKGLKRLITIAENEDFTKEILYGGTGFHRMLKIKKYLNISITMSFIFFLAVVGLFFYYLDSDLFLALSKEFLYVREHGMDFVFSVRERLTGNFLEGLMAGFFSFVVSLALLGALFKKFPTLKGYASFPAIHDYSSFVFPFMVVLLSTSALFVFNSYFSSKKTMKALAGE